MAIAAAYVVLIAVVVLLALTRTQVGRDELRDQIQAQFNERFAGSLHIGTLDGSLLRDLYARDVTLRAPDGSRVATLDSLAARPRWSALWSRGLSLRSLTLIRPHVIAHQRADTSWSLRAALRRESPAASTSILSSIRIDDLQVIDGRVTTRTEAPLPAPVTSGWTFNYMQNEARDLTLAASLTWADAEKRVALDTASLHLARPGGQTVGLSGTLTRRGTGWRLNDARLATAASALAVDAALDPVQDDPVIDLRIAESRIDFASLRQLVPRLPLADAATLDAHVYGTLSRLVVEHIRARRGASRVELTGTVLGAPDSLDVEANLVDTRLRAADVQALWPEAPRPRMRALQVVEAQAFAEGTLHWAEEASPRFRASSTFNLQSPTAGAVAGSLRVRRSPGRALQYAARGTLDSLDLTPLTLQAGLSSRLNGTVQASGQGTSPESRTVDATLQLGASRIRTQRVDSLRLTALLNGRRLRALLQGRQQGGGTLKGTVRWDPRLDEPAYQLDLNAVALDVAPLDPSLPTTRLTGRLRLDGRGRTLQTARGTVQVRVDSSAVGHGDTLRALPPHDLRLVLAAREAAEPRLRVDGSVGALTLAGDVAAQPLASTLRLWATAIQDAGRRAVRKPRPQLQASTAPVAPVRPAPANLKPLRAAARADLEAAGYRRPLQVRAALTVRQNEVLQAWMPALPTLSDGIDTEARLTLDADTLYLEGRLRVPGLRMGNARADSASMEVRASGSLRAPLADTWQTHLRLTSDALQARRSTLQDVAVAIDYARRQGTARIDAQGEDALRALRLDVGVDVRPTRNELTLRTLRVETKRSTWQNPTPGTVALYQDAAVIDRLVFESPRAFSDAAQRLRVQGVLSAAPTDTLLVDADGVSLYAVTQLAGIDRALGGLINGRVALLGGLTAPRIRSDLAVRRLSLDRRLLGRLRVTSRYVPQNADVEISARLDAEPLSLDSLRAAYDPLTPRNVRRVEPNVLTLSGRLRLPRNGRPPRDLLDLQLDVERADLFFFEYIFQQEIEQVAGYTTGTATITGALTDPTFNADMQVREGLFTLPRFGLTYGIQGDVDVDRQGIHMQDVIVSNEDGRADIRGSLLFNEYRYFSFDLRGALDELLIIDVAESDELPFYGTIRASGTATLTGPLSNATLRSDAATTTPDSELFIPVSEDDVSDAAGFIIFADSTEALPDIQSLTQRSNILADRPEGEPTFVDGLEIDINIIAPPQSTVHLVFDPLVGDVVTAVGSGRVQLQRLQGEFFVYGRFDVTSGTYLFTAGEVFVRRFSIEQGTLTWDGSPTNARLDLEAAYRTRASTDGLPGLEEQTRRIPVVVQLDISGFVETPRVDLSLSTAQDQRNQLVGTPTLDAILNQPERATEYATSVLLTNTFLLTTESAQGATGAGGNARLAEAGNQLAFNSVSQLVASQLNRYLNEALPNVDLNLGVQGEDTEDLDIIYGVALRLLDERLVIRGEGVYTSDTADQPQAQGPQGEVVVEVQLSQRVSVEVFYRRTGDDLTRGQTLTSSAGTGLTYQTEFPTWKRLFHRLFGWLLPASDAPPEERNDGSESEAADGG
jgi:hypothetical protein